MEKLNMALASSHPSLLLGHNHKISQENRTRSFSGGNFYLPLTFRSPRIAHRASRVSISAHSHSQDTPRTTPTTVRTSTVERFANISSSSNDQYQTSSVGANPNLSVPPPSSQIGSPLFWVGVGVGLSALFSWGASALKKYAMQQAFKTVMGQMNTQNNQFSNVAFPSGSPFPFPTPSPTGPLASPSTTASQSAVTVDVPATKVEAAPPAEQQSAVKDETEIKEEPKKYAFVDVSPEETMQKSPFEKFEDVAETSSPKNVYDNGAASKKDQGSTGSFQSTQNAGSVLSVEALEKMMEDPTVQKMVYP